MVSCFCLEALGKLGGLVENDGWLGIDAKKRLLTLTLVQKNLEPHLDELF